MQKDISFKGRNTLRGLVLALSIATIFSCQNLVTFGETTEDDGYWGESSSRNDRAVSNETGVAPMAVHFYSDFAASGDKSDKFHDYDYTWDFDDNTGSSWGTSGKSKNEEKGALAVHIFEQPGTYNVSLTISNSNGVIATEYYTITVQDPNVYYGGTKTICVSDTANNNFSGAPTGSLHITTDDLSSIVGYATEDSRILFHRGSSWTVNSTLNWPGNSGAVTLGAYGSGSGADSIGNYSNAPEIHMNNGHFISLNYKQNWKIMDLSLIGNSSSYSAIGGAISFQNILIKNVVVDSFNFGIEISNWNKTPLIEKNDIVVSSCKIVDSQEYGIYIGSERLALLGNIVENAKHSHVIRIWQAYRSLIAHNIASGGSVDTASGLHALKLHGPGVYHNGEGTSTLGEPIANTGLVNLRTDFCIVSNNVFGSSGPWPVTIGPQNNLVDERLTNLIIEKNRFHADFGEQSSRSVTIGMQLWASDTTIRNNVFDGTGAGSGYFGMTVGRRGIEPNPNDVNVYNNTFFRGDSGNDYHLGIRMYSSIGGDSSVSNNIVSYPYAGSKILIDNRSEYVNESDNNFVDSSDFVDPFDVNPLSRDYSLTSTSSAKNKGSNISVFDDFMGVSRVGLSTCDLGAFED